MSVQSKKITTKDKSTIKYLKESNKITEQTLVCINSLSLEDLLAVKFELSADQINNRLREELLKYDISIRDCSNYRGLDESYYRIAIKNKTDNEYLLKILSKIYGEYCG